MSNICKLEKSVTIKKRIARNKQIAFKINEVFDILKWEMIIFYGKLNQLGFL